MICKIKKYGHNLLSTYMHFVVGIRKNLWELVTWDVQCIVSLCYCLKFMFLEIYCLCTYVETQGVVYIHF